MQEKQKTVVQDTELLVGLGKSKRLMAMRESQAMRPASTPVKKNQTFVVNKRDAEIKQARDLIEQNIIKIKASYPPGMQNKLFALRYGSEEKIQQMSLQQLFAVLNINQVLAKGVAELKF
ncbi:hypothetical protein BMR07_07425 [Methylococcaceae bacterium CS1]|nr:hypothetical protein BMR10_07920 [Methylococcaceae bacterium CS4]TXK97096.1 hypothetical protein BMR11_10705 [Methylococcaceae bacterium CS5]TXL06355.1 hypothetical protein BMR07_07425 [Methylococcaceae bacterium CS1]TXL11625.1 hypothetical protein BMR08_03580 [Methylococcaceae bacterium CS2]